MSSINNDIPFVPENTIDPAAGLNEAINVIDALLQLRVLSIGDNAPPGAPSEGDRHIVGIAPTGDWAGQANTLARYLDAAWTFHTAYVAVLGMTIYTFNAGAWGLAGGAPVVELAGDTYNLGDLTPGAWHIFTSAMAVTITVEDDATTVIPADAEYRLEARGAGGVTLVEDSLAVIIPPKGGTLELEADDFALLKRTAADEYKLVGSTVAAS